MSSEAVHLDGEQQTLPPSRDRWLGVSVEERLQYMSGEMRVPHPEPGRIRAEVRRLKSLSKATGRGTMLMVIAPSGWGKTALCSLLLRAAQKRELAERTLVPTAYIDIPLAPSPVTLGQTGLLALGTDAVKGSSDDILETLHYFLEACETDCILVDNVQDIVRKRGLVGLLDCAAWLRKLQDKFCGVIVLLGTKQSEPIVDMEPQLRRRSPAKMRCRYLSTATVKDTARSKRFLHEIDNRLPLAEYSGLREWVGQVVVATYGIQDYIFKITAGAMQNAVNAGREKILLADLALAFDSLFQDAGSGLNPFLKGGPTRALDAEGEPFHKWDELSELIPRSLGRQRVKATPK